MKSAFVSTLTSGAPFFHRLVLQEFELFWQGSQGTSCLLFGCTREHRSKMKRRQRWSAMLTADLKSKHERKTGYARMTLSTNTCKWRQSAENTEDWRGKDREHRGRFRPNAVCLDRQSVISRENRSQGDALPGRNTAEGSNMQQFWHDRWLKTTLRVSGLNTVGG